MNTNGRLRFQATLAALLLAALAAAPVRAMDPDQAPKGAISQDALLANLELDLEGVDFERDRACIRNTGPAGTWDGVPYTLAFAVLTGAEHGLKDGDVAVVAPEGLDATIVLQPAAIVVRLTPATGRFDIPADALVCLDFIGADLVEGVVLGLGTGGPRSD